MNPAPNVPHKTHEGVQESKLAQNGLRPII